MKNVEIDQLKERLQNKEDELQRAKRQLDVKQKEYDIIKADIKDRLQKESDLEEFSKYNGRYWKSVCKKGEEIYVLVDKFTPWCIPYWGDCIVRNQIVCKKAFWVRPIWENGKYKTECLFRTDCLVDWCETGNNPNVFRTKYAKPSSEEEFNAVVKKYLNL